MPATQGATQFPIVQATTGGAPPVQKSRLGLYIGIAVAVLGIAGAGLYFGLGLGDDPSPAQKACKAAIAAANAGKIVTAVEHVKACEGPMKNTARSAIDGAAVKAAVERGCATMEDAKAAESIRLPEAMKVLRGKKCHAP
jgi:hypothetical protein